ncbi:MAG TPA: DoxX family protein [Streptosporangiaceae bacterium]|jgi:hypothetical protein
MFTAYVIVTVVTIVLNGGMAIADFARAPFVLANSDAVAVPRSWLPMLATLKAAGAIGLLLGLAGVPFIGAAAALGLVLFFVGAIATHARSHALDSAWFAGVYLALAAASLVLAIAR